MKKKMLLLFIMMFFFTGCDVVYNLEFSDNIFKENVEAVTDSSNLNGKDSNLFNIYLNKPIPLSNRSPFQPESNEKLEGIDYYDINDISTESEIGLQFSGNFDNNNVNNSNLINFAAEDYNITTEKNKTIISVSDVSKFFIQFPSLNTLTVNLTVNYKVGDNNADEINGNVYTWKFDRDNYKNKSISIVIKKRSDASVAVNDFISTFINTIKNNYLVFVLLGIVLVVGIVYFYLKKRQEKINDL